MERTTIQVGGFEVNCSILSDGDKAWIVDPGQEGERMVELLAERKLRPSAILLTHAHFDHIGGIPALQTVFPGLPVYVGSADRKIIGHPLNQLPPDYPEVKDVKDIRDAKCLKEEQSLDVEVIDTPGHTPGGVCYFFSAKPARPSTEQSEQSEQSNNPLLLSGDTLFAGSIGRTDLPGGDMATLMGSLKKLTALPDDTLVVPGHGPSTSIAAEKGGNPFLQ